MESSLKRIFIPLGLFVIFLLSGCHSDDNQVTQGYIEGDFIYISAQTTSRIEQVLVNRGQQVSTGQTLVILDNNTEKKQYEIANKNMSSEIATLNDLTKGSRHTELNITAAQIAQAESDAKLSQSKLRRYQQLKTKGYVSDFELEQAQTDNHLKQERVRELTSQLASQKLLSRADKIDAQREKAAASQLQLEQSQITLNKLQLKSVSAAEVYDVMYHPGEVVSPGTPILSLLPNSAVKIRFFVPAEQLPRYRLEQKINVKVEGIKQSISARIRFISPKAEYTPPVIYTSAQKKRMVFMIEAVPLKPQPALKLGLPVEVSL